MNIRVFRTVFPNGTTCCQIKTGDSRAGVGFGTLEEAAKHVRFMVTDTHKVDSYVTIDFSPFHDIECPNKLEPCICYSLSAEEQGEFWRHFSKPT